MNVITLSAFLVAAMSLGACARKVWDDPRTLRLPLPSEPPSIDPQLADTGLSVFLLNQVSSTLFDYDSSQRIRPYDAKSYAWLSDGMELKIDLRTDLTWSDGSPLKACQFKDGILRALDPAVPSTLAELLYEINGAAERKSGKAPESRVRILCDDKLGELRIYPVRAYSWKLLHALAYPVSAPIRKKAKGHDIESFFPENGKAAISSGAFVVKEWAHDRRVVLEARQVKEKNLPADRRAGVDTIDLPIVKDTTTAFTMYSNGDLDVLEDLPPAMLIKLKDNPEKVTTSYFTTYMVGFSMRANPVLKDKRVRQALAFALNQGEVPKLLNGGEQAAGGWIPPQLLKEEIRPHASLFQPEKARKLLQEAGFKGKKKFPVLKLFYNSGERHQLLMERAANNWRTELGIQVELNPIEWKVMLANLKHAAPDLYRYAWAAVYPDPVFFLELFASWSANNFGKWKNADFDRLVDKLVSVPLEKRDDAFWKDIERAQKILVEDDPALIPVYHYVRNTLVKPHVKGLQFNWRGTGYLSGVSKEHVKK